MWANTCSIETELLLEPALCHTERREIPRAEVYRVKGNRLNLNISNGRLVDGDNPCVRGLEPNEASELKKQ